MLQIHINLLYACQATRNTRFFEFEFQIKTLKYITQKSIRFWVTSLEKKKNQKKTCDNFLLKDINYSLQ